MIRAGKMKLVLALVLLLITGSGFAQSPAKTIPAFTFFKLDKTAFTDKNLAKDKLIFFCFFDITCEHCQHEMTQINEHINEFKRTAVYLITLNDQVGIDYFMNKYGKNLPADKKVTILRDTKNEFIKKFGPKMYPSVFLYGKNKKILLYDDNPESFPRFLKLIKSNAK
ncbi:MAG: redoxin domain-containing protein [Ferruginibacter sp.]